MYTIASIRTSMSYLLENARNKQRHYGRNRNKSIVFFRLRGCGFTVVSFDFPRICLIYQHTSRDLAILEGVQKRATIFILQNYELSYLERLRKLNL
jgi:hypothetical protein